MSRSGDKDIRDANFFCGRGSISQRSIGNEIVVALRSRKFDGSNFNCAMKAVALTNSNCDCGWNVQSKIVGGSKAGVNEFISHAGLVDKVTKDIFCGAIIGKIFFLKLYHVINLKYKYDLSYTILCNHRCSLF